MTDDTRTANPQPDPPAPTEYYHYAPTPGGPLFVMAEFDNPEPQDKFFDEFRAYRGLEGAPTRLLDPAYLPKEITLEKKRTIPPMFMTKGTFIIVDGAVRSAIEGLEPGRHQFIPVRMIHANGEADPRDFFILNVHHTADAMALEEMGVKLRTSPDGSVSSLALPTGFRSKVKLRRAALDGAGHLFTDRRCGSPPNAWFLSREMVDAIKAAKGRLDMLFPCQVID